MAKVVTLQEVRLNSEDVPAGVEVSIPDDLVKDWLRLGLACLPEDAPPADDPAPAADAPPAENGGGDNVPPPRKKK